MPVNPAYDLTTAVVSTADTFLRESQRLFRPQGLTAAQYNVLNVLATEADGMSQRELSDFLVVDRSNVTGLLDRMQKAGWVQRVDDPADRRVYRVRLTARGRKLWAKVTPRYFEVLGQVTRGLSARQMASCTAALRQMERAATEWQVEHEQRGPR